MVNHDSGVPLYVQIADILEKEILDKKYADGQRLPSENQLCKQYGVSRITVRQALNKLEQKHRLYSVHGKGTYVHREQISQGLSSITSFEKTLAEKGLTGYTEIEQYSKSRMPGNIRQMFNSENIHRLCLVGYASELPLVYYNCYVKSYLAEQMYPIAKKWEAEKKAFSTWDMYKELGIKYLHVEQNFSADIVDNHISKLLHIPKGDPIIKMETSIYEKNVLVEHKIAYYRADKYSFSIVREVYND